MSISICVCSLSGSVFPGWGGGYVYLAYYVHKQQRVCVHVAVAVCTHVLWMWICVCALCFPGHTYVLHGHPASCPCLYLLVFVCMSLHWGLALSRAHSYSDMICTVLTLPFVKSATRPLDSEQILLLTCVSPQVYTSAPTSPRAHLKRMMLVLLHIEVGEGRRLRSQEVSGGEGP